MMLVLIAAIAQIASAGDDSIDWSQAFGRIAPEMRHFSARGSQAAVRKRLLRVLDRVGLKARFDEPSRRQVPGIFFRYGNAAIPVQGLRNGVLVYVHWIQDGRPWPFGDSTALGLFYFDGKQMRGEKILSDSEDFLPSAEFAAMVDRRLVVSGLDDWFGNSPRASVSTFSRVGDTWNRIATLTADTESWEPPKLVRRKGGGLAPGRVVGRGYPKSLSACHATANLAFEEQWSFRNGIPHRDWKRKRNTAYNALDVLYEAIVKRDLTSIRRHAANRRIARRMEGMHRKSKQGEPFIGYPGSRSRVEATVIGVENLDATFHFVRRHSTWVVTRISPYCADRVGS